MSYNFYKILHLLGIIMIFMSYGAILLHSFSQQKKELMAQRKWVMTTNGLGLLFAFIAGFGLLAKTPVPTPWPIWVWLKMLIWVALAGGAALALRKPQFAKILWVCVIVIGGAAAFLARTKPF